MIKIKNLQTEYPGLLKSNQMSLEMQKPFLELKSFRHQCDDGRKVRGMQCEKNLICQDWLQRWRQGTISRCGHPLEAGKCKATTSPLKPTERNTALDLCPMRPHFDVYLKNCKIKIVLSYYICDKVMTTMYNC